jgi:hypothetical protein
MMLQTINGTVNLADPAVYLLFRQAACQVEKASDQDYREAHVDLSEEGFGEEVIAVLKGRLEYISDNWQEGWTAATLGDIACRLFALNTSDTVKDAAFMFLSQLRDVLFRWMKQILLLLKNQTVGREISAAKSEIVNRVLQVAASCRATYAVGSADINRVFAVDGAVSIFVQCSIAIQSNIPHDTKTLPSALRYLLQRDNFLSTTVVEHLTAAISRNGEGLDDAIHSVWEGFSRNVLQPWRMVGARWVMCLTPASPDNQARHVYLNIVDGSLLIDGKTQGNLPKDILGHSLFRALFPKQVCCGGS